MKILVCFGRFAGGIRGLAGPGWAWARDSSLSAGCLRLEGGPSPIMSESIGFKTPSIGSGGFDCPAIRARGLKSRGVTKSSGTDNEGTTAATFVRTVV